jgi:Mg2+ and Co2+ transporter CorA
MQNLAHQQNFARLSAVKRCRARQLKHNSAVFMLSLFAEFSSKIAELCKNLQNSANFIPLKVLNMWQNSGVRDIINCSSFFFKKNLPLKSRNNWLDNNYMFNKRFKNYLRSRRVFSIMFSKIK